MPRNVGGNPTPQTANSLAVKNFTKESHAVGATEVVMVQIEASFTPSSGAAGPIFSVWLFNHS